MVMASQRLKPLKYENYEQFCATSIQLNIISACKHKNHVHRWKFMFSYNTDENKVLEDRVQTPTIESYMEVPTYILLSLSYRLGLDVE